MNQTGWDIIITVVVILGLGLAIWAKVSGQTIPELIKGIKEIFQDTGEEVANTAMVWNE